MQYARDLWTDFCSRMLPGHHAKNLGDKPVNKFLHNSATSYDIFAWNPDLYSTFFSSTCLQMVFSIIPYAKKEQKQITLLKENNNTSFILWKSLHGVYKFSRNSLIIGRISATDFGFRWCCFTWMQIRFNEWRKSRRQYPMFTLICRIWFAPRHA